MLQTAVRARCSDPSRTLRTNASVPWPCTCSLTLMVRKSAWIPDLFSWCLSLSQHSTGSGQQTEILYISVVGINRVTMGCNAHAEGATANGATAESTFEKTDASKPNPRIWSDGQSATSRMSTKERVVAVVTMFLASSWLNFLLVMSALFLFSPAARVILVLVWGTHLLPSGPLLWREFTQSWGFSTWRKYFHFSYCIEEAPRRDGHYVYAEFPHGALPIASLLGTTLWQTLYPDSPIYILAATANYVAPVWKHFVVWLGGAPATSSNFKRLLSQGSVKVVLGGTAEMYMQDPHKERIMLRKRKGFVKIAVEQGCDGIIPVYYFGNTQLLEIFPKFTADLARRVRIVCGIWYGVWGTPLPRQRPIYMVVGKAIPVRKVSRSDPDFQSEVERVHGQVVQAVQDLYNRHRGEYGWGDRPLSIE